MTTNGGSSWQQITGAGTGLPSGLVVTDLEHTGSGASLRLYAAVGNFNGGPTNKNTNGIYVGTPNGNGFSWVPVPHGGTNVLPDGDVIGRIALASDHVSTVYAALESVSGANPLYGLYKTTNNGTSRTDVTPPGTTGTGADGNTWYNLARGVSPNGRGYRGSRPTRTNRTLEPRSGATLRVAYAPSNDNVIYVGFSGNTVVRTTDHGVNWEPVLTAPAPVTSLAVDPSDPNTVYVGVYVLGVGSVLQGKKSGTDPWTTTNVPFNLPHPFPSTPFSSPPGGRTRRPTSGRTRWSTS